MKRGILVSFTLRTTKLSRYQVTKFFRLLYGWKQVVSTQNSRYEYRREGLLDFIPHIKVDQSSFIIPEQSIDEITEFFNKWADKIIFKTFKVLLEENEKW